MPEPLTKAEKDEYRRLWIKVQDGRCAVCADLVPWRWREKGSPWVLDCLRTHDGQTCAKGRECGDCITGAVCSLCMLHLTHLKGWRDYRPSKPVNDLSPAEWRERAVTHLWPDHLT